MVLPIFLIYKLKCSRNKGDGIFVDCKKSALRFSGLFLVIWKKDLALAGHNSAGKRNMTRHNAEFALCTPYVKFTAFAAENITIGGGNYQ